MMDIVFLECASIPSRATGASWVGKLVGRIRCDIHSLRWESDLRSCLLDDIHDTQQHFFLNLEKVVPVTGIYVSENIQVK